MLAPQYGRALAGNGRAREALAVFDLGLQHGKAQLEASAGEDAHAARRQAWLEVLRAGALAELGRAEEAAAAAEAAALTLAGLAGRGRVGRDAQLALAEAHELLSRLQPQRAREHRSAALAALLAAQAQHRLGADHERLRAALA